MKLIVGLGNPGAEYEKTRHNAGFFVLDRLARRHGLSGARTRFHAGTLEATFGRHKVLLMQPTTYMNRSGTAVGEAARFYRLDPADVLVVVDDTALAVGTIRLRPGGGAGGHNGLSDIARALGTDDYPRLRIGIGEPIVGDQRIAQRDYVLGRFTEQQLADLDPALGRAAEAAQTWATEGIDTAMNRYNVNPSREEF
jgi:PTH1 family peptidyl-tRNA hydrolase